MNLLITGAAGFIGSCVAAHFKKKSNRVIGTDNPENLNDRAFIRNISLDAWKSRDDGSIFTDNYDAVIHIGAITNTAEQDWNQLAHWNYLYTKKLWEMCVTKNIPFVYASSAATYGDGRRGFSDEHSKIPSLEPLNLYGKSKHDFDCFAIAENKTPTNWWGLKFFNVFGPNEYHKDKMASVVFHGFNEIKNKKSHTLFKSHRDGIADGEQKRDFIYVKDIIGIIEFLLTKKPASGIYNAGTGQARSFLDLSKATFSAMNLSQKINWVDTPVQYREHYQYFTQADMTKLLRAGYSQKFYSLEESVADYVKNFLLKDYQTFLG